MLAKKVSVYLIIIVVCLQALAAQTVLSPTEGTWANYQSLVLNVPTNAEAYYSLTGENPLETGFAYDGPVLLELEDEVNVEIAVVDESGAVESFSVNYFVDLQETPSYISAAQESATIIINDRTSLDIPASVEYALGNSQSLSSGKLLKISGRMIFERYLLCTLYEGAIPYRYVLQIGDYHVSEFDETLNDTLTITDWNYITFLHDAPIVYAIDDEPLRQSNSGKIYVDRSVDRVLKWQVYNGELSENFETLTLPKTPNVLGIPEVALVNKGVTLSLSDSRYVFAQESDTGVPAFSSVYFIDTINGDAFGFSDEIPIYFDGIQHGSVPVTFIIDKIAPDAPILTATDTSGYSRKDVQIDISAGDTVHYYIPTPETSKSGFVSTASTTMSNVDFSDNVKYQVLNGDKIYLSNSTGVAQLYDVYAYCKDNAGNTSDTVHYKTVIDPYNYYVSRIEGSSTTSALGTKDQPLTDFSDLHAIVNDSSFVNIYVDGVFTNLSSIEFTEDFSLYLTDSSRLIFSPSESISIKNSSVSIFGGSIEQSNPQDTQSLQSTLLSSENSTLVFDNVEFLLSGGINSNCVVLNNSSVQFTNSGITVQTEAYGAGLKANNSIVLADNSRFVVVSETAIGMSLVSTTTQVNNSSFIGIGTLSRAIEFIDSTYSLINNEFLFEGSNTAISSKNNAIWADSSTEQKSLLNNNFEGFSNLIVH